MTGNEKSIVETTLLQIKAVEDAISENAKGILQSTMKEEISELVKESLNGSKTSKKSLYEQAEDPTMGMDDEEGMDDETDTDMSVDTEIEMDDMDSDMGTEDMDMMDTEIDVDNEDEMPPLDMTQSPMSDVLKVFKAMGDDDGIVVKKDDGGNLHLTDNENNQEYIIQMEGANRRERRMKSRLSEEIIYELNFDDSDSEFKDLDEMDIYGEEDEDIVYELEMDEESEDEMDPEMSDKDMMEVFKPKGRIGKMKFKYPSKLKKGVTETSDEDEEMREWNEEEDEDLVDVKDEKETETKEASRTMTYRRRAERDRVAAPSQLRKESTEKEINLLREKNEEYKKALDFFRNKLTEVAVFNSNLAYSTRLFTEHSTTKQEKINILRRFDNVDSLKESKNLYKSIKEELGGQESNKVVTESITNRVVKTPSNGSASNLIESKTYENPQFMRMKDLMTKIK